MGSIPASWRHLISNLVFDELQWEIVTYEPDSYKSFIKYVTVYSLIEKISGRLIDTENNNSAYLHLSFDNLSI